MSYMTPPHGRIAISLLGAAVLSGCMVEHNRRTTIGDGVTLGTYDSSRPPSLETSQAATGNVMHRDGWATSRMVVPVDGTASRHVWRTLPESGTDSSPRRQGEYPTALSAVETDEAQTTDQYPDAARAVGLSLADALLMPGRVLVYPLAKQPYSPAISYDRSPWEADPEPPVTGRPVSAGLTRPASMSAPIATPMTNTTPPASMNPTTPTPIQAPPASRPMPDLPPAPAPRPVQNVPPPIDL
ncbi:MAG: hypothetical protein AAGK04_02485 [Planctomycetota bacterium]